MSLTMSTNPNNTTIQPTSETSGFSPIVRYIYLGYYIIIFLVATVGNCFSILTCYKNFKQSAAVLLAFVASLAVSDLLFTLLTPADLAVFLAGSWVSGSFMCPVQSFLIETSYTASILTLMAISHERFKAVSTPILARSQRIFLRKLIPVFIWVISILSCIPLLYAYAIFEDKNGHDQCLNMAWGDQGRQIYYSVQGVLLFVFPLLYMVYAHFRIFRVLKKHSLTRERLTSRQTGNETVSQRRVGKMLAVVTCIFIACYFPFVVIRSLRYFYVLNHDMIWRAVQLMIFTQAAVNPVIYCFYNKQFRVVFKDLLRCRWKTLRYRPESSRIGRAKYSSTNAACGTSSSLKLHAIPESPVLKMKETNAASDKTETGGIQKQQDICN